jgi:hypothetical protein
MKAAAVATILLAALVTVGGVRLAMESTGLARQSGALIPAAVIIYMAARISWDCYKQEQE